MYGWVYCKTDKIYLSFWPISEWFAVQQSMLIHSYCFQVFSFQNVTVLSLDKFSFTEVWIRHNFISATLWILFNSFSWRFWTRTDKFWVSNCDFGSFYIQKITEIKIITVVPKKVQRQLQLSLNSCNGLNIFQHFRSSTISHFP